MVLLVAIDSILCARLNDQDGKTALTIFAVSSFRYQVSSVTYMINWLVVSVVAKFEVDRPAPYAHWLEALEKQLSNESGVHSSSGIVTQNLLYVS